MSMLPDDYARALLPGVSGIRAAQWLETQLDNPRKRRLDRTLDVHCESDRRLRRDGTRDGSNDCTDLAKLERWLDQAIIAKNAADALK